LVCPTKCERRYLLALNVFSGVWQPGKGEFNVSVEALNFADDLDHKLAAQSRCFE
jgi:hypothetical protein